MRYLAFDIEAANGYNPASICSVGVVVADSDFKVLLKENIWINPRSKYNLNGTRPNVGIDLHLDKDLLDRSPDFSERYEKLKSMLTAADTVVVGHAVDSDVRMLNAACKKYRLPSIDFKFVCSQLLYKCYKGDKNVMGLDKIAAELGLHHAIHAARLLLFTQLDGVVAQFFTGAAMLTGRVGAAVKGALVGEATVALQQELRAFTTAQTTFGIIIFGQGGVLL